MFDFYVRKAGTYAAQKKYIPTLKKAVGKKLKDLSDFDAAIFIRADYDMNISRKAIKRVPTGTAAPEYQTGDTSFSSYDTIAKGVSVFRDGSSSNIDSKIGDANKVRNFYLNIANPNDPRAVTIDTHAMAIALIKPLSANSFEVKFDPANFAFYADAYRELANELGLKTRELQSITWEAARAIFPPNKKAKDSYKQEISDVWTKFSDGEISLDDAQKDVFNKGLDPDNTEWFKFVEILKDEEQRKNVSSRIIRLDGTQDSYQLGGISESDTGISESGGRATGTDGTAAVEGKREQLDARESLAAEEVADNETPNNATAESIVRTGRNNGFSDRAIQIVLEKKGFTPEQIAEAMELNMDLFETMPDEFVDVREGVSEGKQMFADILAKLRQFAKPRMHKGVKKVKSKQEIVTKAIAELRAHPRFQNQTKTTQARLETALRKHFNPPAAKRISKQAEKIQKLRVTANNLKRMKLEVKNFLRRALPKSDTYSKGQLEKAISIVEGFTPQNFETGVRRVLALVEQQRTKMKKAVLKDIGKLVTSYARKNKTNSNGVRARNLGADEQTFFEDIKDIIRAAVSQDEDSMNLYRIELSLDKKEVQEAVQREKDGLPITPAERKILNRLYAMENLSDLANMELEQLQQVLSDMKEVGALSSTNLKAAKALRSEDIAKIQAEATEQLKETFPEFFDEEGNPLNETQMEDKRALIKDEIYNKLKKLKIFSALKDWFQKVYPYADGLGISNYFKNRLAHLNSLTNIVDRVTKGKNFFTENIAKAVNRMDENHRIGRQKTMKVLDKIASTIDGIKNYRDIRDIIRKGTVYITLNGEKKKTNLDWLLRVYALSKNEAQRRRLEAIGYDEATLNKIKTMLSNASPALTEFADKLVEFLSTDYYDQTNAVHRQVNHVNLPYIENYFPTASVSESDSSGAIVDGDFGAVFNAQTASALKERSNTRDKINDNLAFTDVLENHIDTMEKFKAFAVGIQRINDIFRAPAVMTALKETKLWKPLRQAITFTINPSAVSDESTSVISRFMGKYTGFALAFKLIQIPKQASSFINAYEDYNFRNGKNIPVISEIGNMAMFMIDAAAMFATMPLDLFSDKGPIHKAMNISATFRDRVEAGLRGDVYGLESGSSAIRPLARSSSRLAKAIRMFKMFSAAPTVLGDIMGVMGYMINYKRDIANGMSEQQALEKFNDYNSTQQSRRASDKIPLQMSKNELSRAFTMFGSTLFLQINKVANSMTNISRGSFKAKDVRALVLNLGLANALFVFTSQIAKFLFGDDEDEEKALIAMRDAMIGLNLAYQIPLVGATIEEAVLYFRDERGFGTSVTNPYMSLYYKMRKAHKEENWGKALQNIIPMVLGTNVDPFVGLYNYIGEGDPNGAYDALGISPSYRPEDVKNWKKRKPANRSSSSSAGR